MTDTNKPEDTTQGGQPAAGPDKPGSRAASKPGASPQAQGPEELPYIDDPVTKWWIGIIIAVFVVIFAGAIFFGAGGLFDGILDSEEPTPSPQPSLVVTPAATQLPTEAPTATPEPVVTEVPTAAPEPTAEPQPTEAPTGTPTPEPQPTGAAAASDEPPAGAGG